MNKSTATKLDTKATRDATREGSRYLGVCLHMPFEMWLEVAEALVDKRKDLAANIRRQLDESGWR